MRSRPSTGSRCSTVPTSSRSERRKRRAAEVPRLVAKSRFGRCVRFQAVGHARVQVPSAAAPWARSFPAAKYLDRYETREDYPPATPHALPPCCARNRGTCCRERSADRVAEDGTRVGSPGAGTLQRCARTLRISHESAPSAWRARLPFPAACRAVACSAKAVEGHRETQSFGCSTASRPGSSSRWLCLAVSIRMPSPQRSSDGTRSPKEPSARATVWSTRSAMDVGRM